MNDIHDTIVPGRLTAQQALELTQQQEDKLAPAQLTRVYAAIRTAAEDDPPKTSIEFKDVFRATRAQLERDGFTVVAPFDRDIVHWRIEWKDPANSPQQVLATISDTAIQIASRLKQTSDVLDTPSPKPGLADLGQEEQEPIPTAASLIEVTLDRAPVQDQWSATSPTVAQSIAAPAPQAAVIEPVHGPAPKADQTIELAPVLLTDLPTQLLLELANSRVARHEHRITGLRRRVLVSHVFNPIAFVKGEIKRDVSDAINSFMMRLGLTAHEDVFGTKDKFTMLIGMALHEYIDGDPQTAALEFRNVVYGRGLDPVSLLEVVQYLVAEYLAGRVRIATTPGRETETHCIRAMLVDASPENQHEIQQALEALEKLGFTKNVVAVPTSFKHDKNIEGWAFTYTRRL